MSNLICMPGDEGYVEPGSDAWHEHLGCSQVADILGHGYNSANDLWLKLTHRAPDSEHKLIYDRGHDMEPKMAEDARQAGRVLKGEQVQYRDPDRPWLIYHADGVFPKWTPIRDGDKERHGPGVWEAKAPGFHMAHKMQEDGMSSGYIDQTQVGMHVASAAMGQPVTWATFGYLDYDEYETVMFDCPADSEYQKWALGKIDEFWACVQSDTPPTPINPAEIPEQPKVNGTKQIITEGPLVALAESLIALEGKGLSELKAFDKAIRAEIKEAMGDMALVEVPGLMRYTYKYKKATQKIDGAGLLAYCEWLTGNYNGLLDDARDVEAVAGVALDSGEKQREPITFRRSDWVELIPATRSLRPKRLDE